jgi:glycosyltransferase involved in cell wall biosynthesis
MKHVGGVRRVALDLRQALQAEGVSVAVNRRVERTVNMTSPKFTTSSRIAVNTSELLFPFVGYGQRASGVRHALYYELFVRNARWPVAVTVYDMIHELHGAGSGRLTKAKSVAARRADVLIAISVRTAQDCLEVLGIDRPIEVVPLGISNAMLSSAIEPSRPATGRPYVLFVGSRNGYKNFELLWSAMTCSPDLADFSLVLVGGEEPSATDRAIWSARVGAGGVSHVGHVSDSALADLYRRASVLAVPSKYEGFGLPVLEAMAVGCPVCCSSGGSLPEVAAGHARLFAPDSIDECRAAILGAIEATSSERFEASRYARAFTWERAAKAHMRIYRSLGDR